MTSYFALMTDTDTLVDVCGAARLKMKATKALPLDSIYEQPDHKGM
jgi:hypothetical protein